MLAGVEEEDGMMAAAAAGSECSSGCQSGWTTYLDDDRSSYSCSYDGAARFNGMAQQQPCYGCDYSEEEAEEDDLSMVSDASSGPRQQHSAGSEEGAAALVNARAVRRRSRMVEPAAARRQSKMAAAVASTLLEDTASSPAFFKQSKVMSSPEANGYGGAAASMMEMSNAADFSCAFFATTGYELVPPLNVSSQLGAWAATFKCSTPLLLSNRCPQDRFAEMEVTISRGGDAVTNVLPRKRCRCGMFAAFCYAPLLLRAVLGTSKPKRWWAAQLE